MATFRFDKDFTLIYFVYLNDNLNFLLTVVQENLDCKWETVRFVWKRLFTLFRFLVVIRFATFASRALLSNRARVAQCVARSATASHARKMLKQIS